MGLTEEREAERLKFSVSWTRLRTLHELTKGEGGRREEKGLVEEKKGRREGRG